MTPIETKFVEVWKDCKSYAEKDRGYTNKQNVHECVNGAGAFVDFLIGRKSVAGTSYATSTQWPTT